MEKLGGRKFVYALLVVVIASYFVIVGKLSTEGWITFVEVIGGLYVIGNLGSKLTTKM